MSARKKAVLRLAIQGEASLASKRAAVVRSQLEANGCKEGSLEHTLASEATSHKEAVLDAHAAHHETKRHVIEATEATTQALHALSVTKAQVAEAFPGASQGLHRISDRAQLAIASAEAHVAAKEADRLEAEAALAGAEAECGTLALQFVGIKGALGHLLIDLIYVFSLGKVRMVEAIARFPAPIATRESSPNLS